MLFTKGLCLDVMEDSLQEPVRLDCGPDVERVRQRCYRARQHCLAQGDHRFVILRFQIDGSSLVISKHPDPDSKWHRHKLRMLREMRAFVVEYGTGVGRRIGENTEIKISESDEG